MTPVIDILRPGLMPYGDALTLQERLIARVQQGGSGALILLQHPPVLTLGRGYHSDHLLCSPAALQRLGIELVPATRGGSIAWHDPGQIIGYPIVELARVEPDVHRFIRRIEALLIAACAHLGVEAYRRGGATGVWSTEGKLASIALGLRRGRISFHGFALHVRRDMGGFRYIRPCGQDVAVTSLEQILGRAPEMAVVEQVVADRFLAEFCQPMATERPPTQPRGLPLAVPRAPLSLTSAPTRWREA